MDNVYPTPARNREKLVRGAVLICLLWALGTPFPPVSGAPATNSLPAVSPALQAILGGVVNETLAEFAPSQIASNQLALTVLDLTDAEKPIRASYRGDALIYPASVVKLFYLVAAHQWMEDGRLQDTEELQRALRDMIVESYNEATHYVVDLLTGTTSGPELPPAELKEWSSKRDEVNRYFTSLGYTHINVNKKPWCEGPYGREIQAMRAFQPNRNLLTTDACARLLFEIVSGKAVSAPRCTQMMALLKRDPFTKSADEDSQATGFTGLALQPGAKLWSKAGWTSQVRHDAAYVELPDGVKLIIVTFTTEHASERGIIPALVRRVVNALPARSAPGQR